MFFSDRIVKWYSKNKRTLPWRDINDPYKIWLSEIILQQTRVDQGMSYYLKFAEQFPTVKTLAKAKEDEVLKLWQGLGYYSRARNLHAAAKQITIKHKGVFPSSYADIIALKGVGPYTAAAIASIAFKQPYAVVDGNVYRVLSRVFGIKTPIDSGKGKKQFEQLAHELLYTKDPGTYNQAVMEFGALYCKPLNPNCNDCIFSDRCYAFSKKAINKFPVKAKTTKTRTRYFNYIVAHAKNNLIIQKRTQKDIWKGLYEFPLIETEKPAQLNDKHFMQSIKKLLATEAFTLKNSSKTYKHVLSHQTIYARFWETTINTKLEPVKSKKIPEELIHTVAVPRLIDRYIKEELTAR